VDEVVYNMVAGYIESPEVVAQSVGHHQYGTVHDARRITAEHLRMTEEARKVPYLPYGRVLDDMVGIVILKIIGKGVEIDEKGKKKEYKYKNRTQTLPSKVMAHNVNGRL
jgi:hypothetical protein